MIEKTEIGEIGKNPEISNHLESLIENSENSNNSNNANLSNPETPDHQHNFKKFKEKIRDMLIEVCRLPDAPPVDGCTPLGWECFFCQFKHADHFRLDVHMEDAHGHMLNEIVSQILGWRKA